MPLRCTRGIAGYTFHVLNRGVRRLRLFDSDGDYDAFIKAFAEAQARFPVEVFALCLMPNHFHFVVRPTEDGQLAEFMRLGTGTHSKRWHEHRGSAGTGAVYQGRYKAFPVQSDRYFLAACRYVEANPVRARLVRSGAHWRWSSASVHFRFRSPLRLTPWPILKPANWMDLVDAEPKATELAEIRRSLVRSIPFGDGGWRQATAAALRLEAGLRRPGRPATR
jgi:putative transposase